MKKNILLLAFIMTISFLFCSDEEKEEKISEFDSKMVGVWYEKEDIHYSHPAPPYNIRGIQISQDSSYSFLGLDWNTGQILVREDVPVRKIIQSENGIMIIQFPSDTPSNDTIKYEFIHDTLKTTIIDYEENEEADTTINFYAKATIGEKIAEPIPYEATFLLNDSLTKAYEVSTIPPAYASYDSSLTIYISFEFAVMMIKINNIDGTGVYAIAGTSDNYAGIYFFGIPHFGVYHTDDSNGGTIQITELNLEEGRLKANFQFMSKKTHSLGSAPCPDYYELKDGFLDVPLYKLNFAF